MWQQKKDSLYREFKFDDFKQAIEFIDKIAEVAERNNHHPKIINDYNKVEIWLTTHSERKISDKDYKLSEEIDKL